MNFLGMGPMEVLVILVVALIIFGPGKLPEIGAQAGKMMRDFRNATADLTAEFQDSIDDMQATMGEMKATVTDMQRETQELANIVPDSLSGMDEALRPFPSKTAGVNASSTPTISTNGASAPATVEAASGPVTASVATDAQAAPLANGAGEPERIPSKKDPLADFGG